MGRELSLLKLLYRPKASSQDPKAQENLLFSHPSSVYENKASPVQLQEPPRRWHQCSALCFNTRSEPRRQCQTRY